MTIRPLFQIHFSMRKKLLFLLPLAMLLAASCNKETPGEAGKDVSLAEEEVTTSLRIITGKTGTKAYNATDYPLNDGIERLDIYTFRQSGENSGEKIHYTVTPDPSGVTVYNLKDKKNSDIGALVFANLDEDTATLFEGFTLFNFYDNGKIFINAGNFAPDAMPMAAAIKLDYSEDKTIDLPLMRLMCRIDLDKLKIDFEDESLRGKEVWVRNIIIGNAANVMTTVKSYNFSATDLYAMQFGSKTTLAANSFGGLAYGYKFTTTAYSPSVTSTYYSPGTGKLATTIKAAYNVVYQKAKGVLTIDAPGNLYEATVQSYDKSAGQGRIVTAGDMTYPHTFTVNKSFYAYYASLANPSDIICDYNKQVATQKLIVELEIDGETWFYPIELTDTQPNTVYQIENLTIKNLGSAYANFYEKKYAAEFTISVADWTECPIANWNVGVDPNTGEPAAQD